ncbi:MAG TPA: hypothetical protein VJS12_18440 [Steroidobacteraceae bacterium]|nr:hypothetical protein [Steroidobacteraceae bacterium]
MKVLVVVVALLAADSALADRTAYAKTVDMQASDGKLIVHHHHDWSRVVQSGSITVRYTLDEPFGVGNDYSYLSASSAQGAKLWQVASPPLTWLGISQDGRYIIGLSQIKLANASHLAVFARDGRLLARRQIEESACTSHAAREAEIAKRPAAQRRLWAEFGTPECLLPPHRVGGSVTNFVYWYRESDPAPRVIESAGEVSAVELNDLEGKRMRVTFDPRTVRSQQPVDGQQRH